MKIQTSIEKQTETARITIKAECDNPAELKEILDSCRGYTPRKPRFSFF